jgi:UDP-2,4-diacetamido-2,4,6-trideoxy-beta-L-altropyranose hydrolase
LRILFRADASVEIGSGHVFRCAALAHRLVSADHDVQFVCRELTGDLTPWLEAQGFRVHRLFAHGGSELTEEKDAHACRDAIGGHLCDLAVVDHYGLGTAWERAMMDVADRIFVIDDLGRDHDCHLLLDQNYSNPTHERYRSRVPSHCQLLLGPKFALLRPEFAERRAASLSRPRNELSRLLVFMGGSDPFNETCKALNGIGQIEHFNLIVDVVIGNANPHWRAVETACATLRTATLHVQTAGMAKLMAEADCAIGAAGSTTWERCALGVPALVTILAENQAPIAEALDSIGAHRLLGRQGELATGGYAHALRALHGYELTQMSHIAAHLCDGQGAGRVSQRLLQHTLVD